MKLLLSLIGFVLVVSQATSVQIGFDDFKKLQPCQEKCVDMYHVQTANPTVEPSELVACKSGCTINIESSDTSVKGCHEKCTLYVKEGEARSLEACVKSCTGFADIPKIAIEEPIITEVKKVEESEIKNLNDIVPAVEVKPSDSVANIQPKVEEPAVKESDEVENKSSSEEKENKVEKDEEQKADSSEEDPVKDIESPFAIFKDFISSALVRGEPGVMNVVKEKEEDEKKMDETLEPKMMDDFSQSGSAFDSFFSLLDQVKSGMKSMYDKGSYMLRVRIFQNGTVLKEYSELPSPNIDDTLFNSNNDEENLDEPFFKGPKMFGQPESDEPINWKGIPMMIGKPIAVPFDERMQPEDRLSMYMRHRECRPIRLRLSSLCHDVNNLFTCASMHTGLPRWFFMSVILLISFLMIWLGLFLLSSMRRMRRRERIIQYREDYLPLYKDIEFEKKAEINDAYEAGPLPVKSDIV